MKQLLLGLLFLHDKRGGSYDEEERKKAHAYHAGGEVTKFLAGGGPPSADGRNGGGEDHEDIPDDASGSFGALVTEDLLGVHEKEEGEVGDRNEGASDNGSRNGESSFALALPEEGEHAAC